MTLRAVSLDGASLTRPITALFGREGGTIGRSDQNTMALPDPKRYISRQHARISADGAGFTIENVSNGNALVVRQQTLAPGESTTLRPHDAVRIGGYLLEVLDDNDSDARRTGDQEIAVAVIPRSQGRPFGRGPSSGFSVGSLGLEDSLSSNNPFAELLKPIGPGRQAGPLGRPPPDEDLPRLLPDIDLMAPCRPPAPAGDRTSFDDLMPQGESLSIDALIGGRDGGPTPAEPSRGILDDDEDTRAAPLSADRVPELKGEFVPPRVLAPKPPPTVDVPVGQVEAPPDRRLTAGDGHQDLWSAFCRGAGLELDARADAEAMMVQAGALLRLALEGTLQLMSLRASTRNELHAEVTVIRPRENNPLKFSPDAASALERLLLPPARGFMPGETAMAEAMSELVGHTIGTMAGMRAALEGVLERFTPEELEAKLDRNGMLERLLPMARKSRLWELYLQHYGSIHDAAQEDFHALFGKAFLAAYEQQVDRLRKEWATRTA
ncbi:type VI secretion system-associated FHA domain protein TagH [Paucibacter sp. R3-3]|uniref:Type VI secretion system-associated FHA domain protein TagH n=1 Tax=Roseateles agri TaxID=3098619 RepID=A0ABU5DDF1_9BURK|nr:type VI secretion system-associated FHA domain protein TagH [Paucibacter sp. R3-3]MDY0743309.1 type VI secretion system-associated FHA domain protein TagH [Paucibacter sp. R3-3]